jgi:hypothetical protein
MRTTILDLLEGDHLADDILKAVNALGLPQSPPFISKQSYTSSSVAALQATRPWEESPWIWMHWRTLF